MKNSQIIILLVLMAAVAVIVAYFLNKKAQEKKAALSPTRPTAPTTTPATYIPDYRAETPIIDRTTADAVAAYMASIGLKDITVGQAYKTA